MVAFAQARKLDSRERLLSAAAMLFREHGYMPVSIDAVAAASGVSRVTFYRHFPNKAALALELFNQVAMDGLPGYLQIRDEDFRNRAVIHAWLSAIFIADEANRNLLQVFTQANVIEPGFAQSAHGFISEIILGLGRRISAFAARPEVAAERRQWLQAWLLIYEILDQSNHASRGVDPASDPLLIDILADRFFAFTRGE
jgi:AcrR family transcriptional regulator